ncbi:MAG: hypothetical protein ABIH35_03165 [Patescibacteria group bacterium]
MQTLCTYMLAFVFTILSVNAAFAEEFDPVADLQSGDTFLGVDLPEDFDPEPGVTPEDYPTTTITGNFVPSSAQTSIIASSGGILEADFTSTETETLGYQPNVPPFNGRPLAASFLTVEPIANYDSIPSEVPAFSYTAYLTKPQLVPTGPEAAVALAVLTALGVTLLHFRKKTKLFDA